MISVTFFTSFLFLSNALVTFYSGYILYSILFLLLTISSLSFRLNTTKNYEIFDKVCLYMVVLYGGYLFLKKITRINLFFRLAIISLFILTIILYHYGSITKSFSFDEDEYVANGYHSILHIISSFGHHLITLA
jgi:hypothetical protein